MAFHPQVSWTPRLLACLLMLLAGVNAACEDKAAEPAPIPSPSGRYQLREVLEVQDGSRWLRFRVEDRQRHEVFVSPQHWAARHRTDFYWDAQERVWVDSGDVGISVWAPGPEGSWHELNDAEWHALTPPEPVRKRLERRSKPPPL